MRRFFIGILTAFLLLQGSLPAAVAQDINPTDGGNDLYVPAIPAESYSPTFSVQARKIGHNDQDFGMEPVAVTQDGKSSYIVLMSAEPLIAYNGDIAGYSATKPQAGQRLDSRKCCCAGVQPVAQAATHGHGGGSISFRRSTDRTRAPLHHRAQRLLCNHDRRSGRRSGQAGRRRERDA